MHGEISHKEKIAAFVAGLVVGVVILSVVLYQIPAVQNRIAWRVDRTLTYMRGLINPVKPIPTAVPSASTQVAALAVPSATLTPTELPEKPRETSTPLPTVPPTTTPTPIPDRGELDPPEYFKQEINNCGPATLAMHLRYYGWQGSQSTISDLIKPKREDRNVNVEELVAYVNTQVAGLEIQYRVGGDVALLTRLIAAGFPVTVEEAFIMEESYWYNDDRWAGHYLLLTGYNNATQRFTAQDTFLGKNLSIPYAVLDRNWKAFNRVYILVYPPEQREQVKWLLGEQWDVNVNREHAINLARQELEKDSTDSYAWFNLGTNLVYFERYAQAASAYDEARKNGLPQRMLRYQFGPFFAYFHTNRMEDLLAMADYALQRTPNSEEAMLWSGWAFYRQGKKTEAADMFAKALEVRPGYPDALYALDFLRNN